MLSVGIMSKQVQQFMPPKYDISNQRLNLGLDLQDKDIQTLFDRLSKKVLEPILKKDYRKPQPLTDKKLKEFAKISIKLTDVLEKKHHFDQLAQSSLEVYQHNITRIHDNSWVSNESRQYSLKIIDILMDYTRIIVPIAINAPNLLEAAGRQIDVKEFLQSLYGSLLAYVCLIVILDIDEFRNDDRFTIIAKHGYEFAKTLDGYIDTIDILTKPDEDARLRKIK